MATPRQDIRFYLRPEKSEQEAVAHRELNKLAKGWQVEAAKDAFLAGMALKMIGDAIPASLVAMMKEGCSPADMRNVLLTLLSAPHIADQSDTVHAPVKQAKASPATEDESTSQSGRNLGNLISR